MKDDRTTVYYGARAWMLVALLAVLAVVPVHGARKSSPRAAVSVSGLKAERLTNPMSLDTPTPRLGWVIESTQNDVMQTEYHIIVASTEQKAEALEGDLWDVQVQSDQSQWVEYGGKALRPDTRCYWRVKVNTTKGSSDWSAVACWNVGLLTEGDWRGQWIGWNHASAWDVETEHSRLSARYLRREFNTDKTVARATLYISGLGMYEAYIDGEKVGQQVLAPAPTDYRRTVLYNAFDVTPMLMGERHALAVVLGNGRYYTMQQDKKPYKITRFGYPTLRANLIVQFTDGSQQTIATDERWKICVDGAIRSNNEYDGETYDARKELEGWTLPGYDDSAWPKAERTAIPLGTLRGAMAENMHVVKQLKPQSVTMKDGRHIVDMGQNMAGWLRLRLDALSEGDSVVIRFAEKLDSTGGIWTENLRHAESTDRYYANGREKGLWWHPTFVYHGFRYAEVSGLRHATADDFTADVISDAMEETGHFVSSDSTINKVYRNAYWGILSNYKGMPVDCPQRDERQPWLGDRTRGCYGEAFLFDNGPLYAKWARDICEAQREDGCIPDVAPAFWNYYSDDFTWASALPMTLAMLAGHYGDTAPLTKYYPNVKRWMLHIKTQYQRDGIIHCGKYADWCVPPEREELIHSEDPARKTDVTLISTAYYYRICQMMEGYASMLKNDADAQWFSQEAELTKKAFNRQYLNVKRGTSTVPGHILYPDSTFYGNNTVTANLLPYTFGMIDDKYVRQEVEKQIVKKLVDEGAITTGVIGTGWLMHALTSMGRTDVAWMLATNKKYPSWGYMAEHGATTIWELWNGDTASPKMNSGNHVMLLGDLIAWLYECVAGIGAADAGFKHIAMKPDFSVDEIDDIDASYQSIYGRIVSRWQKRSGRLYWHVEIPANCRATLALPGGELKEIGSGSYDIEHPLAQRGPQVVTDEFIYSQADFPQCHSASIVETRRGDLVATFFGGTKERNPDVCIWVSRKPKGTDTWTKPVMVADGTEMAHIDTLLKGSKVYSSAKPAFNGRFMPYPQWTGNWGEATVDGVHREACWNPVLFENSKGELQLYFKIGPNVANWEGWRITSKDGGKTWSRREKLPDGLYGPIKNKPVAVGGKRIVSPSSDERDGWKLYFELSDDDGKTWRRTPFVEADDGILAIQPSVIILPDGRLQALCRTRSRHIGVTYSSDNGETWTKLKLIDMPNNNSGIDAVTLDDGTFAMICNDWPIEPDKQKGARTPLSIMRSNDGTNWKHWITLEDSPISQYSYPSIIQTRDGHIHVVYTWRRQRVKHVELKEWKE
jgi:alpha-L-rhamnosidase